MPFRVGKNIHTRYGWFTVICQNECWLDVLKKLSQHRLGDLFLQCDVTEMLDVSNIYLLERHWLGDVSLCIKCAENTKTYTGSLTSGDSGGALFDTQSMHTLIIIWPSSTTIKLIYMFPFQAK